MNEEFYLQELKSNGKDGEFIMVYTKTTTSLEKEKEIILKRELDNNKEELLL